MSGCIEWFVMDEGLKMCHGLGCVCASNTLCFKLQDEFRNTKYKCGVVFRRIDWLPLYPHKICSYPNVANLLKFFIPLDVAAGNPKWERIFFLNFSCPASTPVTLSIPSSQAESAADISLIFFLIRFTFDSFVIITILWCSCLFWLHSCLSPSLRRL